MRSTIRLPADVEISCAFLNGDDLGGEVEIVPETEPNGKFNKLKKLTINVGGKLLLCVVPKERRQSTTQQGSSAEVMP